MEKYEVLINGSITLEADGIGWEYPQTDSEGSGATDEIRKILQVRAMTECTVKFYDLRAGAFLTKTMYPVSDAVTAHALINGEYIIEAFELRFVQTVPNS